MAGATPHIDVFIPFYCFGMDADRVALNEKILRHAANVRRGLSRRARVTFTVLGSEGIESKKLVLKYLRPDEYVEYDQQWFNDANFNVEFAKKMNHGAMLSAAKKPDICLIMGSNDFVSANFFDQLVDFYDPETPQAYGIGNYYGGKRNIIAFGEYYAKYNGVMRTILWDGVSNFSGREKYAFTGGVVGFNRAVVERNEGFLASIGYDEGETERVAVETPGAERMESRGVVFLNLKTGKELTKMEALKTVGLVELDLTKDYEGDEIGYFHEQLGVFSML
jgi:hypothetical protein